MHTAASLPPRKGSVAATDSIGFRSGRKFIMAKRRCSGNFFDKKNSCENVGAKLEFLDSGITASPNKSMRSSKISGVLGSSVESPGVKKKSDCSSGKKVANRGFGWSDGEGDDGLGVTKGRHRRRKEDYMKEKCNTAGNPGSKLLMGNVTILKRGEKIEDVVANRSSDEEESSGSGGPRGKADSVVSCGREGFLVREEKRVLDQCLAKGRGFPAKKPMPIKKAKVVARVSQVCPVLSFSDMNLRDVETDKGDNREEEEFLNRLGPDPSVLSKEVGSGILGCVSSGSRVSETGSDDDVVGESEKTKRSLGTDCNVQSASTRLAIPRVKTSDNFSNRTPEPVEYSNRGFLFEKWAGPAYANSPSPTCLPLPKFFIRQKVRSNTPEEAIDIKISEIPESPIQEKDVQTASLPVERSNVSMFSHGGGFDVFATRNLRRLLQLE